MGQTSSQPANIDIDESFDSANYIKDGVTEKEVRLIRSSFESLDPVNGQVKIDKIIQSFEKSKDRDKILQKLSGRQQVDFDTYFDITKEILRDKKFNMENVEIDTQVRDTSCVCCQTVYHKKQ